MNEVAALKITSLQRCIVRAQQVHAATGDHFSTNHDRQDAKIADTDLP